MQMGACLVVHGQHVGPERGKRLNVSVGVDDHEVNIQGLLGMAGHGLNHRHPKADVGHKHPIHDVQVEPVCVALVDPFYVSLQVGKV